MTLSKGKVERPYRWLHDRIVRTCAIEKLRTVDEVRAVLKAELHRFNNHQVHSTTWEIPSIRFEKAKKEGNSIFRPFALPKPYISTKYIFRLRESRTVNGYRNISLFKHEIVVTCFDKLCPLWRFSTGDLASYIDEPCPCGKTSPRITKIRGMIGDHVRVKSMFAHKRELEEAIAKMKEISKAQMMITLSGHIDFVTWIVEPAAQITEQQAFQQSFTKTCQQVFKLKPDVIEIVPKGTLPEDYEIFVDKRW